MRYKNKKFIPCKNRESSHQIEANNHKINIKNALELILQSLFE